MIREHNYTYLDRSAVRNKEVALLNVNAIWNLFQASFYFLFINIMKTYSWIVYLETKIVTLHSLNIKVIYNL